MINLSIKYNYHIKIYI